MDDFYVEVEDYMTWEEAMEESKRELGYSEGEYIKNFQEVVDNAKQIIKYYNQEEKNMRQEGHKEYLKSSRWKQLRAQVMMRDNYRCQDCKRKTTKIIPATQVHHISYENLYTDFEKEDCIVLCEGCHKLRHDLF